MPSSQCRFAIRPSQATQASCVVEWRRRANRAALQTDSRSQIFEDLPVSPAAAVLVVGNHLFAACLMMPMRVSQSGQLAATFSLSTELRWRVLSRCCMANTRAGPSSSPRENSACAGRNHRPPGPAARARFFRPWSLQNFAIWRAAPVTCRMCIPCWRDRRCRCSRGRRLRGCWSGSRPCSARRRRAFSRSACRSCRSSPGCSSRLPSIIRIADVDRAYAALNQATNTRRFAYIGGWFSFGE